MVNWENELKKYIARKVHDIMGVEIPVENILTFELNLDLDLPTLTIEELGYIYAFAIMKENFEQAKAISEELANRNCEIKLDIDEKSKTGVINLYVKPEVAIAYIDIQMKVLPDGLMIDFEKENF
jgi:predicted RNase H-related nuclease YkuK (DUF458 family)